MPGVMDARLTALLTAAADEMDKGCDPFDAGFIADHQISHEENGTLAGLLALGARLIAFGLDRPDLAAAALDATHLAGASEELVHSLARWRPLAHPPRSPLQETP